MSLDRNGFKLPGDEGVAAAQTHDDQAAEDDEPWRDSYGDCFGCDDGADWWKG